MCQTCPSATCKLIIFLDLFLLSTPPTSDDILTPFYTRYRALSVLPVPLAADAPLFYIVSVRIPKILNLGYLRYQSITQILHSGLPVSSGTISSRVQSLYLNLLSVTFFCTPMRKLAADLWFNFFIS